MIETIRQNIDRNLKSFLKELQAQYRFKENAAQLFEAIEEYCQREGKRIRPTLFILSLLGYRPSSKIGPDVYRAAVGIEMLHNFMLIHDDIIDNSDLRRGKPTLHKILAKSVDSDCPQKTGNDLSIIAGDIVYAFALQALLSLKAPEERKTTALRYFIETTTLTAIGEYVDTINGLKPLTQVSEKDVFVNYTLKTARYTFASPLVMGAIVGGASPKAIKSLYDFGILVGQAFQIQDDIIGIFGTEKTIGKSILSDLAESKKTILVTHALGALRPQDRKTFENIFNKKKKTVQDLEIVRAIFVVAGSLRYSINAVNSRIERAIAIIRTIKMNKKYRDLIEQATLKFLKQTEQIAQEYLS